ncbi:MAG TPA: transposase [Anaerolineales bacterium]|nr:transposase [Anaerolineales bacterium]
MPRRTISFTTGGFYHIYNRGVNKLPIFLEPRNYPYFLDLMNRYLSRDGALIAAYCLMPNHYHLLVRIGSGSLSARMHQLGMAYTNAVNKAYGRVGPLFQGRFKAVAVEHDAQLLHLSRYIHLNPVAAGLADEPADWAYSSYANYLGLRNDKRVHPELVLIHFARNRNPDADEEGAAAAYKQFVEGLDMDSTSLIGHITFDK